MCVPERLPFGKCLSYAPRCARSMPQNQWVYVLAGIRETAFSFQVFGMKCFLCGDITWKFIIFFLIKKCLFVGNTMTLYKCPYKSGDLSYHFLLFTSKRQEKGERWGREREERERVEEKGKRWRGSEGGRGKE